MLLLSPPALFDARDMHSPPGTNLLQHRSQRPSILRDRIAHARRYALLFVSCNDAVAHQLLQVSDQHPLGDAGNAAAQLARPHRPIAQPPQDRPFHRPSITESMASIGHCEISFFETGIGHIQALTN